MTVFVDTSVWYAAADAGDTNHHRSKTLLQRFQGSLLTSDHVLIETWHLTARRLGTDVAETLVKAIRNGQALVEMATLSDLEVASQIHDEFRDQQFSIVDRTSWSLMQRLGIHEAISFDRDYSIFRFGRDRRMSFTVHR
ncbi:type II toxin-antitoxin system VapC family toxin [Candidatus Poriferisocius sp.]|uniref:type II toxin-antitoxin system VapC family toxin n=1 Tax=Candidatus Poriferisocius sp. TaxID=3101276 RepID=UPI003B01921E